MWAPSCLAWEIVLILAMADYKWMPNPDGRVAGLAAALRDVDCECKIHGFLKTKIAENR